MALEITVTDSIGQVIKKLTFTDPEINDELDQDNEDEEFVEGEIVLYQNPFDNCQSFCVASAVELIHTGEDPESVRLILQKLLESVNLKPQGVFDIREDDLNEFLKVITPWALKIYQMPYESTNKSHMTMLVVQFNTQLICH